MKPATRLAQIILDTPNWESDPALVAEVNQLRWECQIGTQDKPVYYPPKDMDMHMIQQLIKEYQAGFTLADLGKKYNLSRNTVRDRILKPLGVYVAKVGEANES